MYNEKQTKNIITKESIANESQSKNKMGIVPIICVSVLYIILLAAVLPAVYFLVLGNLNIGTIGDIIFFVFAFICILPLLIFVFFIVSFKKDFKEKTQDFCVVTDTVVYKAEIAYRYHGSTDMKKIVHFSIYGDIEVNSTWYQLTSENDIYYMVVPNKDSKYVSRCYPAKLYEYKE